MTTTCLTAYEVEEQTRWQSSSGASRRKPGSQARGAFAVVPKKLKACIQLSSFPQCSVAQKTDYKVQRCLISSASRRRSCLLARGQGAGDCSDRLLHDERADHSGRTEFRRVDGVWGKELAIHVGQGPWWYDVLGVLRSPARARPCSLYPWVGLWGLRRGIRQTDGVWQQTEH